MVRYVYDFAEGGRDRVALLGDKGARLAEMTRMGLPVPAGFTVSAEACRAHAATGAPPPELDGEVSSTWRGWSTRRGGGSGRWTARCCCRSAAGRSCRCRGCRRRSWTWA